MATCQLSPKEATKHHTGVALAGEEEPWVHPSEPQGHVSVIDRFNCLIFVWPGLRELQPTHLIYSYER